MASFHVTFNKYENMLELIVKAILDIPDAALLSTFSLSDLIDNFCVKSGVDRPDVICLPIWDEGGPQFDSAYTSAEKTLWKRYKVSNELRFLRENYPEIKIYLSIMPDLPGIKSSNLTCRDQFGDEKARACIVNRNTQSLIHKVIDEAVQRFEPDGIVLDIVDIQPQSADASRKYVEITCFCEYCRESMDNLKFDPDSFKKIRSPLSLVLHATDSGISFITPKAVQDPDEIVQEAIRKGYISSSEDPIYHDWAQTIINYVRVRTKITGSAVGKIREAVKAKFPHLRVGAIINTNSFDWTGGSDLRGLIGHIDEVWLDTDDLTNYTAPSEIEIYAYTLDRSRYRVDAFFEYASDRILMETTLGTGRHTVEGLLEIMRERAVRLETANNLDKTVVTSFSEMSFISGFVGIPFDKTIYQSILQAVRKEATLIAETINKGEINISSDKFREYMIHLVQLVEQGVSLGRREIIGLAAQMELID